MYEAALEADLSSSNLAELHPGVFRVGKSPITFKTRYFKQRLSFYSLLKD
jgi:hypothetical protein